MGMVCKNTRSLLESDLLRIGMGNRFWEASLDKIPDSAAYKKTIIWYLENIVENVNEGNGLLFHGKMRVGKTAAAVIIAKSTVEHMGASYFSRADDLVTAIMEKKRFDDAQTVEVRTRAVDTLVIDDLGSEHKFEYGKTIIERIIRYRYDYKKPLILTTNLDLSKIEGLYSEGAWSVVRSMVAGVLVDGTDFFEKEKSKLTKLGSEAKQ